jgi:hypothetical protein
MTASALDCESQPFLVVTTKTTIIAATSEPNITHVYDAAAF